jgi:hypothetical protein
LVTKQRVGESALVILGKVRNGLRRHKPWFIEVLDSRAAEAE